MLSTDRLVRGTVLDVQRGSLHDGPGIRTTVFMKGCPLHCSWCHNPESWKPEPELMLYQEKCVLCGACAAICPAQAHHLRGQRHEIDREKCTACGKCTAVCPAEALKVAGRSMSAGEVMDEVVRDRAFYDASGGGLTLSGGEPLMQGMFAETILRLSGQAGISTCVETSGCVRKDILLRTAALVDLFLFDVKAADAETYHRHTGVPQAWMQESLRLLDELGCSIRLRCPIIPGINDNREHAEKMVRMAEQCRHAEGIELMAYHDLGRSKWHALGLNYALETLPGMKDPDRQRVMGYFQGTGYASVRWG